MIGLGTLFNIIAIVIGGTVGFLVRKGMKNHYQDTLMMAMGVCVIFIGISGALKEMLIIDNGVINTTGIMMMISSFFIGSLIGEWLGIEKHIEQFGNWLKKKTNNDDDASFINGFVTASLTVCVGAMAVIGALQDGIMKDYSTLMAKGIIDMVIIMIMTTTLGKGCIFAAIPVGIFQGAITIFAKIVEPVMTMQALSNLSLTGSIMIFIVGVNLVWKKNIRVANMLPTLIFAVIFAFLPF